MKLESENIQGVLDRADRLHTQAEVEKALAQPRHPPAILSFRHRKNRPLFAKELDVYQNLPAVLRYQIGLGEISAW